MNSKKVVKFVSLIILGLMLIGLPITSNAQSKKDKKAARKLVSEADSLYRKRDYAGAIEKYAEALTRVPKYPYAHFSKGYAHLMLKQNDLALNDLTAALDQGHPPLEVYKVRWKIYFDKGNLDTALSDVSAAQKLEPDNSAYHVAEGRILIKKGKYLEALEKFDRALNLGSKDGNIYYYKAIAYNKIGDYAQQESSARTALSSGADCAGECWFFIGDYFQRERRYQEAISAYNTSISSSDSVKDSYYNLAEAYRLRNNFTQAVKTAQAGLRKFQDDPDIKVALVRYYSLAGNNSSAIKVGEEAIGQFSQNATAYKNLCRAYSYQGQFFLDKKATSRAGKSFDRAIELCKRALELKADDGESQYYLGRTYQLKNSASLSKSFYTKSIKGLEEFVDNNPDDADGFYILGNAYLTTQQYPKAVNSYRKCLEISPRFAEVIFNLGYTYYLMENQGEALKQLKELEKLDPKKMDVLKKLINAK